MGLTDIFLNLLLFVYPAVFIIYQIILYEISARKQINQEALKYSNLPVLSIIVPIKNEEISVIQGLLDNLSNLIWDKKKLEIIIVSDDNEDYFTKIINTVKVPKDLTVYFYRREKKLGYKSGALQYGFEKATGDLILTIDVDSRLPPNALINAYEKMQSNTCDAIVFQWNGYSSNQYSTLAKGMVVSTLFASKALFEGKEKLKLKIYPVGSGTMFSREALRVVNGWDYRLVQDDLEIGTRLIYNGKNVCASGIPIYVEVPDNFYSFYVQQTRWAMGSAEVLRNRLKYIIKSKISFTQRMDLIIYLLQYTPVIVTFFISTLLSLMLPFRIGHDPLNSPALLFWLVSLGLYASLLLSLALKLGLNLKDSLMGIGRLTAFTVSISPFIVFNFFKGLLKSGNTYVITPKGTVKKTNKLLRIIAIIGVFGLLYLLSSILYIYEGYYVTGIWLLYYSSAYLYTMLLYYKEL
ncbi:glycosyltransferase [Sulfolobus acidocaldarius]|uniref:Probable glycosyltransferase Saci_1499 n=4 Tax=Sulfolobus acidocaldarius TaxID=2285 RepID=Y1499_SULAC|nr:glycosyltransferase family 2 protein [Sulfolobus acidocaldarius]AAY80820.1 conserved membrane glocosyltransferase [Sulfolobus acidocaldarius DSM 639]AGE71420.1 membrane glocosyltransferase [Sulfolobus acidocaldarius N8]AGE73693.1 membrane glocosyltransferase [Sulfolobus acidocaldarius Ron12/I]ALU30338.1 glycosyl transferase family 2 [Sulfolobus acidocaldarius]ALU31056.1 glycosyl transferase family 2 [Sulfolobus acidocaldarius]